MQFGISTHLFHDRRLERDHLVQIAGHGFEAIELFATRSHFDYHDAAAVERLRQWLEDAGLRLHSVHAPITDRFGASGWSPAYSNALSDNARRSVAVRETEAALRIAQVIPFEIAVVHLGTPESHSRQGDNNRAAAVRSIDEIARAAEPLGVAVALEVIPNGLSDAASLVAMLERDVESRRLGICLDFGHAHLLGGAADAIETAAEHLVTTHVHDNHGREDEHLVPYRGTIDWNLALITMQKIGYAGTYLMELANAGDPAAVLDEARRARQRIERTLAYP